MSTNVSSESSPGSLLKRAGMWPAWIALGCALALTLVAWRYTERDAERQLRLEFDSEVRQLQADLNSRIAAYTNALHAAAGLFSASDEVAVSFFPSGSITNS